MARRGLLTILVVVTLATAGCSPEEYVAPPPAQASEVAVPSAAAQTLADLQRALVGGDRQAAIDLGSDTSAQSLLEAVATNVSAIGLTDVTFGYVTETGRTSGADGWDAVVAVTWRFQGFDQASARQEIPISFSARGRRIAGIGRGTEPLPLWLGGPVTVQRVPGAIVVTAGNQARPTSYARWARRAVAQARAVVGGRGNLVVEVPADSAALHQALSAEPGEYDAIAAVTAPVDGSRVKGSPVHVFINPAVFGTLDKVAAQVVMTHEAVHAVTGAVLARRVPLWLVEGFADYVALRDVALPISKTAGQVRTQVRQDGVPKMLPSDNEFDPAGPRLGAVYESAWQVTVTLADRGGEAALVAFYRAVLGGTELRSALQRRFDWTEAELTAAWQDRLATLAGVSE